MPEVIDELLVRLGMNVDNRSFDQANVQISSLTGAISRFTGSIAGIATIGAGVTGILGGFAINSAKATQSISELSIRTGESVEQVSRLQSAFRNLTGIGDTSSLDSFITRLSDWRNHLTPDSPDYQALARSGFDAQAITRTGSNREAVEEFSRQYQERTPEQRQAAQQFGLFNPQIAQFLARGPQAIDSGIENAQNITTDEQVRNSQEFNRQLETARQSLETLGTTVGQSVIPSFNRLLGNINSWVDAYGKQIPEIINYIDDHKTPVSVGGDLADKFSNWVQSKFSPEFRKMAGINDEGTKRSPSDGDRALIRANENRLESASGVSDSLWQRLIRQESGGNHNAVSQKGAFGVAQLMPATAKNPGFGIEGIRDDSREENERVGRAYLSALIHRYSGDQSKALAAYNWGMGNVDRSVRENGDNWLASAPQETRNYVPAILGNQGTGASGGGNTTHQYNIDARGSHDPAATQAAVEEGINRLLINASIVASGNFPDDSTAA
ncbi:lytic transglycosylase domain-containing protein [Carnimonas bestiolae]|uniref:lytic transglycosylase domain-containing protein n=1 Tax=Carnimonas bestiolae TaxID=3402172 RepID=UPI003EDC9EEB